MLYRDTFHLDVIKHLPVDEVVVETGLATTVVKL